MTTQVKSTPHQTNAQPTFKRILYRQSIFEILIKLDPRQQVRNPMMLVVFVGSIVTTTLFVWLLIKRAEGQIMTGTVAVWLWATLLFVNVAEVLAGGYGHVRAEVLRRTYREVKAKKLSGSACKSDYDAVSAASLCPGDVVLVDVGETIPADGDIIEGLALVDESIFTGQVIPVMRTASEAYNVVIGGTCVVSGWVVVRIKAKLGEGLLNHLVNLMEKHKQRSLHQKTRLNGLLSVSVFVFSLIIITWLLFRPTDATTVSHGMSLTTTTLVALLAALMPTISGGLLGIINIAGLDCLVQHKVIPLSDQAVKVAEQVNVLLLDKRAAIVPDSRRAVAFIPLNKTDLPQLAEAARLISVADETPEGRSIIALAEKELNLGSETENISRQAPAEVHVVPYNAETDLRGVDIDGMPIRKGSPEAIAAYVQAQGHAVPLELKRAVKHVVDVGDVPQVVALNGQAVGVIHLYSLVNKDLKKRLAWLRRMDIKSILITSDAPLVAAAVAIEAGMDDFLGWATPETKLALMRRYQTDKHRVAVTDDDSNDASLLSQADLIVAMNRSIQPPSETARLIALDYSPTKLIDLAEISQQRLVTRKSLTIFSLASDVAKYFVLIPVFTSILPALGGLNVIHLATPMSAILATVIFNALCIILLTPLAWRGVPFRPVGPGQLRQDILLIYGLGGLLAPFIGIKMIDLIVVSLGLV